MGKVGFLLALALLLSFSGYSQSQKGYSSTKSLWIGATLKRKVSDRVSVTIEQQTRTKNRLDDLHSSFLEAGVKYKFGKRYSVKTQLRYSIRNDARNTMRVSMDFGSKWRIKPAKLMFKYRARFQNAVVTYTGENITYLRNRVSIEYKVSKKWKINTMYESFFRFNDRNEFRTNRYGLGGTYSYSKRLDVDIFYLYDQEFNVKKPEHVGVFGVQLNWAI